VTARTNSGARWVIQGRGAYGASAPLKGFRPKPQRDVYRCIALSNVYAANNGRAVIECRSECEQCVVRRAALS
jgi:hypothetical protein